MNFEAGGTPLLPEQEQDAALESEQKSSKKFWVLTYVIVFAVIQVVIVGYFLVLTGDTRRQKNMLREAAELHAVGEHDEALEILLDYGGRWPGAYGTQNFNRRLGEYHLANGDDQKASELLAKSIELDSAKTGAWALQGLAEWRLNNREKAVELFQSELANGDSANDLAFGYLGQAAYDQENYPQAFEYFSAVKDPETLEIPIEEYRTRFREKFLASIPNTPHPPE